MNILSKTIYQTWYKKDLPESIQKSIDHMRDQNPNYSYELHDDESMLDFISKEFNENIKQAYNNLKIGAAKADLWRYLILFKRGGVYLDIDSVIYNNLDTLITDDCAIISREKNYGKFVQWCLVFPPQHPILEICINKCVNNILNKTTNDILELTGPVVYSQSIKDYFNDQMIYTKPDQEINKISHISKTKVYSFDYDGYALFTHPNKNELYTNKLHWRDEAKALS